MVVVLTDFGGRWLEGPRRDVPSCAVPSAPAAPLTDRARTALVVVVPESERVVSAHRLRLDRTAESGVPAHVTVLFPFLPVDQLDVDAMARLTALFAEIPGFPYRFDRTAWFGDEVLWLAPVDPAPFVLLTQRVFGAFPDYPPFEGQFEETVPHLTIGQGHPRVSLAAAEREVAQRLPVDGLASGVSLLAQDSMTKLWSVVREFALG